MVQTAEPGHRYNLAASYQIRSRITVGRRSFGKREMRSVVVVVTNILVHQPPKMPFIQHNDMIEQVPAATANPAFCDTILPETSEAHPFGSDTETLHETDHLFIEISGPVEEQIFVEQSYGNACRSCCMAQALLGCRVTLQC